MSSVLKTLRLAFRTWARQPVMTIAVILCLGVGIGITAVVFSLINGILLRPLPYVDADGIYMLWNRFPAKSVDFSAASGWEFLDFREQDQIFEEVGGLITWPYNLTSLEPPERVVSGRVTASLFRILGVQPMLGRVFDEEEEKRGDSVVVLSHAFWQRAFGGDPNILGQSLSFAQRPYTIIGVMPQDMRPVPANAEVWVPLVPNPNVPRDLRGVIVMTRLKDGVTLERARRDLDVLESRFRQDYPALYPEESGWELVLQPFYEVLVGPTRGRLWVSFGAVFLVLLLACANIAHLLLVRALSRQKEYALRTALGADRRTLLRQLFGENLLIALMGGALGWWLATIGLKMVVALQPGNLPRLDEVAIDLRVILFIFVTATVTGLIFGLYPAWRVAGQNLRSPLSEGGRSGAGQRHPLFRRIVIGEMTVAVVVLISTGLMWRSFEKLQNTDPGFRTSQLVTMLIQLPRPDYPAPNHKLQFHKELERSLIERFGEDQVGLISQIPLSRFRLSGPILAEGQEQLPNLVHPAVGWRMVGSTFFQTMGIELLQGRGFRSSDNEETQQVVIVDSKIVQRLWPGENPLGKRLRLDASHNNDWRTVVGVVAPIKQERLAEDAYAQIYIPYVQMPQEEVGIVLRNSGDFTAALDSVRGILRQIDPYLPISNVQTIEQLVERSLSGSRFLLTLFGAFGLIALILTTAGIYGVIAYTTAQRTGEIGLRQALGARQVDIFLLILGEGLRIAGLGILLGLFIAFICSIVLGNILASMAFGVSSTNPTLFISVALVLLVTALFASFLPALRAARLDPAVALQRE